MKLKAITIVASAPFSASIANAGEKLLGNFNSIKKLPTGEVYVSGQKMRHALFSALDRVNGEDDDRGNTYVANADGITDNLRNDLRADLGGYMQPKGEAYLGKRMSPVSATFAIAKEPSQVFVDLLQRKSERDAKDMTIAQREVSAYDEMVYALHLDVDAVGVRHTDRYDKNNHVEKKTYAFIDKEEKRRRIRLFLEAAGQLTAFSHSARNANSAEPNEVFIVLDTRHSRKAIRLLHPKTTPQERENILAELKSRGAQVFHGNDKTKQTPVKAAFDQALEALKTAELNHPEGTPITVEDFKSRVTEALLSYREQKKKDEKKKNKTKGKTSGEVDESDDQEGTEEENGDADAA